MLNRSLEINFIILNKEKKDPSRIQGRVVCLPYTFKGIIYRLKNYYIEPLKIFIDREKDIIQQERRGDNVEGQWQNLAIHFVETEFLSKTEYILDEKLHKKWNELKFDSQDQSFLLSFQGFMHSLVAEDNALLKKWQDRFNDSINFLNSDGLTVTVNNRTVSIWISCAGKGTPELIKLFEKLAGEKAKILSLIDPKQRQSIELDGNMQKIEKLRTYLTEIKTALLWENYLSLRSNLSENQQLEAIRRKLAECAQESPPNYGEIDKLQYDLEKFILDIEKREVEGFFGGKNFRFSTRG